MAAGIHGAWSVAHIGHVVESLMTWLHSAPTAVMDDSWVDCHCCSAGDGLALSLWVGDVGVMPFVAAAFVVRTV